MRKKKYFSSDEQEINLLPKVGDGGGNRAHCPS